MHGVYVCVKQTLTSSLHTQDLLYVYIDGTDMIQDSQNIHTNPGAQRNNYHFPIKHDLLLAHFDMQRALHSMQSLSATEHTH